MALADRIIWYQTILKICGGSPKLQENGKYTSATKQGLKHFQKIYHLDINGKVDSATNYALCQIAMEWLDHKEMEHPIGKKKAMLRNRLMRFQREQGLVVDGKVGVNTQAAMVRVLNKHRPLGQAGGTGWKIITRA